MKKYQWDWSCKVNFSVIKISQNKSSLWNLTLLPFITCYLATWLYGSLIYLNGNLPWWEAYPAAIRYTILALLCSSCFQDVFSTHSSKAALKTELFVSSWAFFGIPEWFSNINHLQNIHLRWERYPHFTNRNLINRLRFTWKVSSYFGVQVELWVPALARV